ncbi:MAG: DNA repair protein RadA, partial [Bacteroidota bacterium]|nr:DNA repair protein RadA [Bacteroidota bacterium]
MSKVKSAFICQNCGFESPKWVGKCPSCEQWNTFVEELIQKENKNQNGWKNYHADQRIGKTINLNEITCSEENRIETKDAELNRVLGGGIVPGSLVLVAGEP